MVLNFQVDCPNCHFKIHVPFLEDLKAQAIEEYDLAETSAQQELSTIKFWLHDVSLWDLLKWFFTRTKAIYEE